jgi:hypothetical protein
MKKADVELYDKLHGQLVTMVSQFEALSKKNPNDPVNEFKIGLVNKLLADINGLIGNFRPFPDFEQFENSPRVFNSDVLLILAQYCTAMSRFKGANTTIEKSPIDTDWMNSEEKWNIEDL